METIFRIMTKIIVTGPDFKYSFAAVLKKKKKKKKGRRFEDASSFSVSEENDVVPVDFEERLLESVRSCTQLYDRRADVAELPLQSSQECWEQISGALGASAALCKNRWKAARDRFVRAHNKVGMATIHPFLY